MRNGPLQLRLRVALVACGAVSGLLCGSAVCWLQSFWVARDDRPEERARAGPPPLNAEQTPTPPHYLDLCLAEMVKDAILRDKFGIDQLELLVFDSDEDSVWPAGYAPRSVAHFKTVSFFDWRTDTYPSPIPRGLVVKLASVHKTKDQLSLTLYVHLRCEPQTVGATGSIVSYDLEQRNGAWQVTTVEHRK